MYRHVASEGGGTFSRNKFTYKKVYEHEVGLPTYFIWGGCNKLKLNNEINSKIEVLGTRVKYLQFLTCPKKWLLREKSLISNNWQYSIQFIY